MSEMELIRDLVTLLNERMTAAGHPAQLVNQEHLGVCSPKRCSPICEQHRDVLTRGMAYLMRHEPEQLKLEMAS